MRGLHLNSAPLGSDNHSSPNLSPESHLESPASTIARKSTNESPKRKGRFDPTIIIDVSVGRKNSLLPSFECSMRCTFYFKQRNDAEGISWKKVTKTTKAFYRGEFQKYIKHPGYSVEVVYKAWNKKAAERYKDWMSSMSKLEVKPAHGISQSTWDEWSNYWKTDKFQKISNLGKRNRDRNGKGMVNHTGGSQTFEVTLQRMRDNGEDPDPAEFHERTHTRKVNNETIFCDDHAKQVNAAYLEKEKEALSRLQSEAEAGGLSVPMELPRLEKVALFKDAAGGEKKGAVYGSGSAAAKFYSLECGVSLSSAMDASSTTLEVVELRQKVIHLEETLAREREERNKLIAESEFRMYQTMKKMMRRCQQHRQDEDDNEDDGENNEYTDDEY